MSDSRFIKPLRWPLFSLTAVAMIIAILSVILMFEAFPKRPQPKVGFIVLGDIKEPGWNMSNYQGIERACEEFNLPLLVRDKVPDHGGKCSEAIHELVNEGCSLIALASFGYAQDAKQTIADLPKVTFLTNSAEVHLRNLMSNFVRMYEGRYLTGIIAGQQTKSGVVGYVAAMPNEEVNRGLNAFTLGVLRANPQARVIVAWTGSWQDPAKETENARRLVREKGADVLAYHQDDAAVPDLAEAEGVDFIGYNVPLFGYSEHHLVSILCRWDIFYSDVLRRFLREELDADRISWLGVDRGVVMLSTYSPRVDVETRAVVEAARMEFLRNEVVFSGPLRDSEGNVRCPAGEVIADDTLLKKMDWQIEGVEILD
ncbi:MAG: BMP family ABC transporter substrate-binding protein [Desulfovibrio sp.]|nr:BMP family ABC transporter substrate-binding protein [Desulfovibrio sp.]